MIGFLWFSGKVAHFLLQLLKTVTFGTKIIEMDHI